MLMTQQKILDSVFEHKATSNIDPLIEISWLERKGTYLVMVPYLVI
jgi:hypothetical protein